MSSITIDAPEARTVYPASTVSSSKTYQAVIKYTVWTLGAVIFCLAMIDFYAQTYANESGIALKSVKEELLEVNKDLRISDVEKYIVGSPIVQTRPADKYTHICKEMKQYTWKGFFKTYSITIYLGLGTNPSVDFVHCPGETKELPTRLATLGP